MPMNHSTTVTVRCAALAALSAHALAQAQAPAQARASAATVVIGPYIGAAFGNCEVDDSNSRNDEPIGRNAKIDVGYPISMHFGVQAG